MPVTRLERISLLAEGALRNVDTLEGVRPYLRRIAQLADADTDEKPSAIGFRMEPTDEPSEGDK
jgi:hypothetical protein